MFRSIIFIVLSVVLAGCSHFSVNGMMCDQIASDPFATIPRECRNYNEEMAEIASRPKKEILSPDEMISFEKK